MKLIDLNPRWLAHGGEHVSDRDGNPVPRREKVGLSFECPCGCETRPAVYFENPPDGGPKIGEPAWHREGETFDDMTLSPSLLRSDPGGCSWHGYLRNGVLEEC